jgi:hypothetical protein
MRNNLNACQYVILFIENISGMVIFHSQCSRAGIKNNSVTASKNQGIRKSIVSNSIGRFSLF